MIDHIHKEILDTACLSQIHEKKKLNKQTEISLKKKNTQKKLWACSRRRKTQTWRKHWQRGRRRLSIRETGFHTKLSTATPWHTLTASFPKLTSTNMTSPCPREKSHWWAGIQWNSSVPNTDTHTAYLQKSDTNMQMLGAGRCRTLKVNKQWPTAV